MTRFELITSFCDELPAEKHRQRINANSHVCFWHSSDADII